MLSQTGQYALRAVVCIAKARLDGNMTATEVAERTGLPVHYLAKILHVLVQAGLLRSVRGRAGGYRLTRPPDRLTVADVLAPFGRVHDGICLLNHCGCHHHGTCPMRLRCQTLTSAIDRFVHTTRIADLARLEARRPVK